MRPISSPPAPLDEALDDARESLVRDLGNEVHPLVASAGDRLEAAQLAAELVQVEGARLDRAARGAAARLFGVVVAVALGPEEAQLGHALKHLDGLVPVLKESLPAFGRSGSFHHGCDVLFATFQGVDGALALEHRVGGNPEGSAGAGGGTAHVFGLLDHGNVQAQFLRGQRGGQPGAGADDQQVDFVLVDGDGCKNGFRCHVGLLCAMPGLSPFASPR